MQREIDRQGPPPQARLNVVAPALARAGAERIVVETVQAIGAAPGFSASLYVMDEAQTPYPIASGGNTTVHVFDGDWSMASFRKIALEVSASPTPLVYTHLIPANRLAWLWELGVATIPVVHNVRAAWLDPPTAYNHPKVPFVVAVADAVADQLRGVRGCIASDRHHSSRAATLVPA